MLLLGDQEPEGELRKEGVKFHPTHHCQGPEEIRESLPHQKAASTQQELYPGAAVEAARVPAGMEGEPPPHCSSICHPLVWICLEEQGGTQVLRKDEQGEPRQRCPFPGQLLLEARASRRQTIGLLEIRLCAHAWQLNSMKARSQWTLS